MFVLYTLALVAFIKFVEANSEHISRPLESCNVGDIIQNECIQCVCTTMGIFECTAAMCNDTKSSDRETEDMKERVCQPNQLYVQYLITCICTNKGQWPHKSCYDSFYALNPRNLIVQTCVPNSYVKVGCNVCKCGANGKIGNRCTKNVCNDDSIRRSSVSVFGTCHVRNWYSYAPCQFCYCAQENILFCNSVTINTSPSANTHSLQMCGTEFIKEILDIGPTTAFKMNDPKETEEFYHYFNANEDSGANVNEIEDISDDLTRFINKHSPYENSKIRDIELLKNSSGSRLASNKFKHLIDIVRPDGRGDLNTENDEIINSLRRSNVTINSNTKCIPGSTAMKDCNNCFCLKNGKLLCTNNKCQ